MSKASGTETVFASNVPVLERRIVQKWLELNNLKWKDVIIVISRMILKRGWFDSVREGKGPPGFAEIDNHFMEWLDQEIAKGTADPELVAKYKNVSFIERYSHQLKPVTRSMLKEIVEEIEAGTAKNGKAKIKIIKEEGKTGGGVVESEEDLEEGRSGGGVVEE